MEAGDIITHGSNTCVVRSPDALRLDPQTIVLQRFIVHWGAWNAVCVCLMDGLGKPRQITVLPISHLTLKGQGNVRGFLTTGACCGRLHHGTHF
jgi:hypothetical protein